MGMVYEGRVSSWFRVYIFCILDVCGLWRFVVSWGILCFLSVFVFVVLVWVEEFWWLFRF